MIPDIEIESVQKIVFYSLSTEPFTFIHSGQEIRINSGPFSDLEGYLVSVLNKIHIELL